MRSIRRLPSLATVVAASKVIWFQVPRVKAHEGLDDVVRVDALSVFAVGCQCSHIQTACAAWQLAMGFLGHFAAIQ